MSKKDGKKKAKKRRDEILVATKTGRMSCTEPNMAAVGTFLRQKDRLESPLNFYDQYDRIVNCIQDDLGVLFSEATEPERCASKLAMVSPILRELEDWRMEAESFRYRLNEIERRMNASMQSLRADDNHGEQERTTSRPEQ